MQVAVQVVRNFERVNEAKELAPGRKRVFPYNGTFLRVMTEYSLKLMLMVKWPAPLGGCKSVGGDSADILRVWLKQLCACVLFDTAR